MRMARNSNPHALSKDRLLTRLHYEIAFSARVIGNITVPGRQRGGNCHYLRLDFINVADWWIAFLNHKLHSRTNFCCAKDAASYYQLNKCTRKRKQNSARSLSGPYKVVYIRLFFISTFCIFKVFQIKCITQESIASSNLICQFKKINEFVKTIIHVEFYL